ncbi:unnamed protein product [Allacma fusca]|uniref:Lipase n=1 Tax=Allacma fusca TaxID=39272 RepID=A0A8J2KWM4_9HEXA|nr:unnamed protein product [Allacma fusca]
MTTVTEILFGGVLILTLCRSEAFWFKLKQEESPMKVLQNNFPAMPTFNFSRLDENSDYLLSTPGEIKKYGFNVEIHHVVTEDSYILELHRIPTGKNNSSSWRKSSVLVMHGYSCTSLNWIMNHEDKVLPYKLAEEGYDVWLGNFRGNKYSNRHLSLDNNDTRFWNFSWHEMGIYDVPAMVDYILKTTEEPDLFYVAHSMGNTAFLVCMSLRTEYNDKIKALFALAPVAFFNHIRNTTKLITPFVVTDRLALDALGHGELVPGHVLDSLRIFGSILCSPASTTSGLCDQFLRHITGFNTDTLNKTWVPALFRNYPDSSSARTLLHFLQLVKSGRFCQYDYGVLENFRVYSRLKPPSYNLTRVTAPVAIYWSTEDWLASPKDVQALVQNLPNVFINQRVESPGFTHLDFLASTDSDVLLYNKVIQAMDKLI